jgi:hypothetical protein
MVTENLFQAIPFVAQSIFVICIWLVLLSFLWSFWNSLLQGWADLQRLHQIPCSSCAFFTGEYYLKCTIRPRDALTKAAIDCLDYEPVFLHGRD